jgi:hypothetical protein
MCPEPEQMARTAPYPEAEQRQGGFFCLMKKPMLPTAPLFPAVGNTGSWACHHRLIDEVNANAFPSQMQTELQIFGKRGRGKVEL